MRKKTKKKTVNVQPRIQEWRADMNISIMVKNSMTLAAAGKTKY